jgi:hypothetical protein
VSGPRLRPSAHNRRTCIRRSASGNFLLVVCRYGGPTEALGRSWPRLRCFHRPSRPCMVLGIVEGRDPGPARPLRACSVPVPCLFRACSVTCGCFNPRGAESLGWWLVTAGVSRPTVGHRPFDITILPILPPERTRKCPPLLLHPAVCGLFRPILRYWPAWSAP